MSKTVGLDRAVEYVEKLEQFRAAFQKADTDGRETTDIVAIETGRKFDKVYVQTFHQGKPLQKLGRYMVDRNSWVIYGIKSWAQINERRTYGTLDTVDQYDWSASLRYAPRLALRRRSFTTSLRRRFSRATRSVVVPARTNETQNQIVIESRYHSTSLPAA